MTRVVLVQYWIVDHLGIMSIAAFLKQHGHTCNIILRHEEKNFAKKIQSLNPDIVGFSCNTGAHVHALRDAKLVKRENVQRITILGGSHATFSPEIIYESDFDIICRGEGEHAMLDLCSRIDQQQKYFDIANLWVKENSFVHKNEVRVLEENLDSLPFPDRTHYQDYFSLKVRKERAVMVTRGCPYNCSFCFNISLRKLYKNKGTYVRHRSIENVIQELVELKNNYDVEYISFEDDTFLDNKDWIQRFLIQYKKHIAIPFRCHTRFDTLDEENVTMLKDHGCYLLGLGLESGNEQLRSTIFNKQLKTKDIINGAKLLRKHNLMFCVYNIIGAPNETVDQAIETVQLNRLIKADACYTSLFQPYPGTPLTEEYREQAIVKDILNDVPSSYWSRSVIKQKNIKELENLHKLFYLLVKIPIPATLIKRMVKMHIFILLYHIVYTFFLIYYASKTSIVSHWVTIYFAFRERKMY